MLLTNDGCRIAIHSLRKQRSASSEQKSEAATSDRPVREAEQFTVPLGDHPLQNHVGRIGFFVLTAEDRHDPRGSCAACNGGLCGDPKAQFYHLKQERRAVNGPPPLIPSPLLLRSRTAN